MRVFTDHTESLYALAFCPSGRWLATGGADGDVFVYDMQVGLIESHQNIGVHEADMGAALPGHEASAVVRRWRWCWSF
jgi:WD40 repeat protein